MQDIDSQYSTIVSINKFNEIYVESFGFNETNQPVNSSFCNISNLEVYRGREQAIEISHQDSLLMIAAALRLECLVHIYIHTWLLSQYLF